MILNKNSKLSVSVIIVWTTNFYVVYENSSCGYSQMIIMARAFNRGDS